MKIEKYSVDEFQSTLDTNHIEFVRWTGKLKCYDPPEYEDRDDLFTMGKNSSGIWIDEGMLHPRHISLDQAYEIYLEFLKKCNSKTSYDIIVVQNDESFIEDNENI